MNLIERLLDNEGGVDSDVAKEAADEIERLGEELADWKEKFWREREQNALLHKENEGYAPWR